MVDRRPLSLLGQLHPLGERAITRLAPEPPGSIRRPLTRFLYSLLLCDSPAQATRYATTAIRQRLRGTS
jgi:hypothetical protein